jgi:hypothetical protein
MTVSSFPKINSQPANTLGYRWFRSLIFIFATVLACQAFWILAAEFSRPPAIPFPTDPESAADAATNRSAAHLAAQFGVIRGDLWAEDALTYSDVLRHDEKNSTVAKDSIAIEQARKVAERTLAFAPHDARIWLVLASIDSRFDWLNGKASAALRNSYYTGANETSLIPVRLFLSLSLPVISDSDFQQLVRHDLRTIVTRKPEMKSAIVNAYQYALPEGRQFAQDTLKELEPNLLSNLPQKQ